MEFEYARYESGAIPQLPFGGPAEPPATVTTTVPREYVHKSALSEVLLTGWHRDDQDSFTITAQWPRAHCFYRSQNGLHDPLLFAETVRQIFPLLSHAAYTVPFGHHLIWEHFRYAIAPGAAALEARLRPAEVTLYVNCHDVVQRRGKLGALSLHVEARRDGVWLGSAQTRFSSHAPAIYRRLRAGYADVDTAATVPVPLPISPKLVGHELRENVVLAATTSPRRWQLRVDTEHPVLFDHPVDHVPGALMLEAARQAAHVVAGPARAMAAAMDTKFTRFAELDAPCWVEAEPEPGTGRVRVSIHQEGQELFTARVSTTPLPARRPVTGPPVTHAVTHAATHAALRPAAAPAISA
ncbi:ScbA/BarX family gamma-butyrolactone biosynthesis protein [Streptomyces sp. G-G2]|uniref:ScbA/BarX family gamma-butyrolactone biosynthesis protein n=1 Tax=Streptomyces sp. G-G2 TaxID=3046201 RepID=UPI0024BA3DA7|nr:ScbA/BarX family gamma-butyrolactone biosynthesis protein [Streptomyces sp. G-G2]MDJ0382873.1 ScbA/BarX family gamma-butyrolactone biosynthesis protein [Streptomyces sp. G-G2]